MRDLTTVAVAFAMTVPVLAVAGCGASGQDAVRPEASASPVTASEPPLRGGGVSAFECGAETPGNKRYSRNTEAITGVTELLICPVPIPLNKLPPASVRLVPGDERFSNAMEVLAKPDQQDAKNTFCIAAGPEYPHVYARTAAGRSFLVRLPSRCEYPKAAVTTLLTSLLVAPQLQDAPV